MNDTYSIKDLIRLLRNRILLIAVLTLCGGAAAFGISRFLLPLQYSSHITMYVQSYIGISGNSTNNISNSKQLVNTYIEVLKEDDVMEAVGNLLMQKYDTAEIERCLSLSSEGKIPPSAIRSCLRIGSETDTSAVKVISKAKNAEMAADICNDLAKVAPRFVNEAVGVGSINTIGKAKVCYTPVAPDVRKNTLLGMAAAFVFAAMIILLKDVFDETIKDGEQISRMYNKAVIGEIPQFGSKRNNNLRSKRQGETGYLITGNNIPSDATESYKTIRANISFTAADTGRKVIAVSSPSPCEGRSTAAANLAVAFAQAGSHVLLIDGDMREPVQHKFFRVQNHEGLSTLISQGIPAEKVVKRNVAENLDLITAGPVPTNPSELLASDSFRTLIDTFSGEYEYIIIDTPPVTLVSDAVVMKGAVSSIILMIRYGVTTYDELSSCMKQIGLAQIDMPGFVINEVQPGHGSSRCGHR